MNLNKCERCGCFFSSSNYICPKCISKDENDIILLKNFLISNDSNISIENLSLSTGISIQNVTRFLKNDDVNSIFNGLGLDTNTISNISL